MRRRSVLAVVLALGAACASDRRLLEDLPPPSLGGWDDGATVYRRACASCHGIDGRGGGPVAGAYDTPPPDLTLYAARRGGTFPRDEFIAVVTGEHPVPAHGRRDMPVWSERFGPRGGATAAAAFYARRQVEVLADHVASLQRNGTQPKP